MVLHSLLASFSVLFVAVLMQRAIYQDWLHDTGPLRLVGTTIAALLTFGFVLHWQLEVRQRHLRNLRRFEVIAEMNDRIRNSLQAIECLTYASDQNLTQGVREAVGTIDAALSGVIADPRVAEVAQHPKEPGANTQANNTAKGRARGISR
jgi:hypothetical protein